MAAAKDTATAPVIDITQHGALRAPRRCKRLPCKSPPCSPRLPRAPRARCLHGPVLGAGPPAPAPRAACSPPAAATPAAHCTAPCPLPPPVLPGYFKLLGKGQLPQQPVVVRAKFVSKLAEKKIKEVGAAGCACRACTRCAHPLCKETRAMLAAAARFRGACIRVSCATAAVRHSAAAGLPLNPPPAACSLVTIAGRRRGAAGGVSTPHAAARSSSSSTLAAPIESLELPPALSAGARAVRGV